MKWLCITNEVHKLEEKRKRGRWKERECERKRVRLIATRFISFKGQGSQCFYWIWLPRGICSALTWNKQVAVAVLPYIYVIPGLMRSCLHRASSLYPLAENARQQTVAQHHQISFSNLRFIATGSSLPLGQCGGKHPPQAARVVQSHFTGELAYPCRRSVLLCQGTSGVLWDIHNSNSVKKRNKQLGNQQLPKWSTFSCTSTWISRLMTLIGRNDSFS